MRKLSEYQVKDIEGYEGRYAITDCGKVYAHSRVCIGNQGTYLRKGRWLVQAPDSSGQGYLKVILTDSEGKRTNKTIHRLVAEHFIDKDCSSQTHVDHIDADKFNNNAFNLQWITPDLNNVKQKAKDYKFISPDGLVIDVWNLREFCRDHRLDQSAMVKVGKGTAKHHKGWTREDT